MRNGSNKMRKLRYGIIGLGGIGFDKHLPEYAKLKDEVEIIAAADISESNLQKAIKQYNIPYGFTDYRELLAMKDIDFVSVCLPNFMHAPVTIEALQAGKHVHCEKPMARNGKEAQNMLDAKITSGKKLMIGLNNRFTPYSRYIKQYIDEGSLGEIYFAKCGWLRRNVIPASGWFLDKNLAGGGALIDLGVHYIDLVMYFMNFPKLRSIMGKTYSKFINSDKRILYSSPGVKPEANTKFDVDDMAVGFIELQNDAGVQFEISWASNTEREMSFYELYGTRGGVKFVKYPGEPGILRIYTVINGEHVDIEPKITPVIFDQSEFKDFIGCIMEDREPKYAPVEQCVEMMKIIDAIYASSETRKQIVF